MVHKFPYIYSINQEALEEVVTHYWTPSKPLCHLAGFLGQSRPQKSKQDAKHAKLRCRGGAGDHCGFSCEPSSLPSPRCRCSAPARSRPCVVTGEAAWLPSQRARLAAAWRVPAREPLHVPLVGMPEWSPTAALSDHRTNVRLI